MRYLVGLVGVMAIGCSKPASAPAAPVEPMPGPEAAAEGDVFRIDGHDVTREAFEARIAELTGPQEQWSCAETTRGGITSWIQTDADGVRWRIREESDQRDGDSYEIVRDVLLE